MPFIAFHSPSFWYRLLPADAKALLSSSNHQMAPQPIYKTPDAEAERRLREAEERLREAIEELQRRQRTRGGSGDGSSLPPCDHAGDESCVANAIGNLCQSFLLSYGVRVGIGILLRAFKLARGQSYSSLLDLKVTPFFFFLWYFLFSQFCQKLCENLNFSFFFFFYCSNLYLRKI